MWTAITLNKNPGQHHCYEERKPRTAQSGTVIFIIGSANIPLLQPLKSTGRFVVKNLHELLVRRKKLVLRHLEYKLGFSIAPDLERATRPATGVVFIDDTNAFSLASEASGARLLDTAMSG